MAEDQKPEGTPEKTAPTLEEVQAQLAATNETLAQIKSAQAGSDKSYQKASKDLAAANAENERLIKENMTAAEQAKYVNDQDKAAVLQSKNEVISLRRSFDILKAMEGTTLSRDMADYVKGDTEAEIRESITFLSKHIDAPIAAGIDTGIKDALGKSVKPGSGNVPTGDVDQDSLSYDEMVSLAEKGELHF